MHRELVLASASPQRRQLLAGLGLPFRVHASRVSEAEVLERDPARRARLLARLKAEDVAALFPGSWVIGCDTLVVAPDGTLLEKPLDAREAGEMLERQSGRVSSVHSALCLLTPERKVFEDLSSSSVHFKKIAAGEREWWIASGLWRGRSGAFQIDGLGQLLIERVNGDWSGVVGLPVFLLGRLFKEAGWDVLSAA